MHTIKSNIAGDPKKKQITKEHLYHYLNAYCMWWYCGSELEVNLRMVYVWIYGDAVGQVQNFTKMCRQGFAAVGISWDGIL